MISCKATRGFGPSPNKPVRDFHIVARQCAAAFRVDYRALLSKSRFSEFTIPRHVAMFLVVRLKIENRGGAAWLFDVTTGTISDAYERTERMMAADPAFASKVLGIESDVLTDLAEGCP